jgi:hypothetical protein
MSKKVRSSIPWSCVMARWNRQMLIMVAVVGLLLPVRVTAFDEEGGAQASPGAAQPYFEHVDLRADRVLRMQLGVGSFLGGGAVLEGGFGLFRDPVTLELFGGLGVYGSSREEGDHRATRLTLGVDIRIGGRLAATLVGWGVGVCGALFGQNWSLGRFEPGLLVGVGGQTVMGNTPLPNTITLGGFVRLGIALDVRFDSVVVGARLTGSGNRYVGVSHEDVPSSLQTSGVGAVNLAFHF